MQETTSETNPAVMGGGFDALSNGCRGGDGDGDDVVPEDAMNDNDSVATEDATGESEGGNYKYYPSMYSNGSMSYGTSLWPCDYCGDHHYSLFRCYNCGENICYYCDCCSFVEAYKRRGKQWVGKDPDKPPKEIRVMVDRWISVDRYV